MQITKLILTVNEGGSVWIGPTKITIVKRRKTCSMLTIEAPDTVLILRGSLVTDEHAHRDQPHGPWRLQEGFDVTHKRTGLDAILWETMATYPELVEAKQEAEFAVTEGRMVRVIDERERVVYTPSTECKICDGDKKVPCGQCAGTGGETVVCDGGCNGTGDVACECQESEVGEDDSPADEDLSMANRLGTKSWGRAT